MKVLITGGAGFIGSHLADALCMSNEDVTVIDNFTTGSLDNLARIKSKIKIIEGDIRDEKLINDLVSKVDLVFHMAAALGVDNILNSTLDSISVNITGSEVVLKAAAEYNKRIIIASTSEIYGKNQNQPLSETDDRVIGSPQKIRWSYSDSKAIEEATATVLYQTKGLRVTTVRLFNTVGPRQKGQYGMVLPRFVQNALINKPLSIYGDGKQTRVFCHISDVVEGLLKIVKDDTSIGEVYNLGGVGETSISELAHRVIQITNSTSKIEYIPYEKAYPFGFEDMQRRVPDITKLKLTIDWEPRKDLNQIIQDITNFFNNKSINFLPK
jgi:UDP-glucose 4-epimerase